MSITGIGTTDITGVDLLGRAGSTRLPTMSPGQGADGESLRDLVGNFVGNVFYGTLLREMQASTIKGKYLHGGRGEEVFRGQLHMELAKRMGQNSSDPIANHIFDALKRYHRVGAEAADSTNVASTQ